MLNENSMEAQRELTMEAVLQADNLRAAYLAVKANNGAAGVDGMEVAQMKEHLEEHWDAIAAKLLAGEYRPAAVRAVEIPKASGGVRLLGIPTVIDRMIQQALLQAMGPVFEAGFSESSFGFRPGRSTHDAVAQAQQYVKEGKRWVVDIDLKNFFDQVNHDRLMTMVGRKIRDRRLLRLIGEYLRAPQQGADGKRQARSAGTPQGGPLSPLLANIYLDPLDKELERRGVAFVRYADDIAIYAGSPRAAERIFASVTEWLEKELGLEVNRQKSGSGPSSGSRLLGFNILRGGGVRIAPEAIERLRERVRRCWDARQNRTSAELRDQWREYIEGWWNHFEIVTSLRGLREISGWIRRHIRKCFWLRWHSGRGRFNALWRLGVRGRSLGLAHCGRGAWVMAAHVVVKTALPNRVLDHYGLSLPWDLATEGK